MGDGLGLIMLLLRASRVVVRSPSNPFLIIANSIRHRTPTMLSRQASPFLILAHEILWCQRTRLPPKALAMFVNL